MVMSSETLHKKGTVSNRTVRQGAAGKVPEQFVVAAPGDSRYYVMVSVSILALQFESHLDSLFNSNFKL